jgi:hypothetical protein
VLQVVSYCTLAHSFAYSYRAEQVGQLCCEQHASNLKIAIVVLPSLPSSAPGTTVGSATVPAATVAAVALAVASQLSEGLVIRSSFLVCMAASSLTVAMRMIRQVLTPG